MVVIVDNVTAKIEEGSDEVIVKAVKSIERDINDLLRFAQACSGYETIIDYMLLAL